MQPIGYWVIAISQQGDFMKWGENGDNEFPYKDGNKAGNQASWLKTRPTHKDDFIFILKVFPNGQMIHYDYN